MGDKSRGTYQPKIQNQWLQEWLNTDDSLRRETYATKFLNQNLISKKKKTLMAKLCNDSQQLFRYRTKAHSGSYIYNKTGNYFPILLILKYPASAPYNENGLTNPMFKQKHSVTN